MILAVKSQDTETALQSVPEGTTVVCAQNGVENEELALARNPVLGMLVWMFALHLEPGVVALAALGRSATRELSEELMREGQACFDAGGIEYISPEQLRKRCADVSPGQIAGQERPGGSVWQSRQRGAGTELRWLTGYIVELGKKFGVPTPRNAEVLAASGF